MSGKRDGIRQRGNSWLVDVQVNGKRRTATCHTYDEARIKRLQLEADMRSGVAKQQQADPACWTLRMALNTSMAVRWTNSKNETKAKATAEEALEFFGDDRGLDTIKTADVDQYVAHLKNKAKNGPATINRKLAALSALFTDAMEREGCTRRPRIIRQPEPTHRIRYLAVDEEMMVLSLLQQWQQTTIKETVITLIDTGMRVGELLKLAVRDVDLNENIISIWQNKGDLPRSVPMTDRVRQIIEARCERSRGLVFFDLNREVLRYYWDRVRSAMDLDDDDQFVPHALRHTCATRLVQAGVSLFVVQKLLGHSTITVTQKYAHLAQSNLREAIDVLQGKVVPASQPVAEVRNIVAELEASKRHATSVNA